MADDQQELPFNAAKLAATSRYSILNERYNAPTRRTELLLSHTPRHALCLDLQFTPRFVEKAFWQWYTNVTLQSHTRACLLADIAIWVVCCFVVDAGSWVQVYAIACLLFNVCLARLQYTSSAWYDKHVHSLVRFRRILTLPYLRGVPGAKAMRNSHTWPMILWHLLVRPGAIHNAALALFFMDYWLTSAALSILTALVLGTSATEACQDLLATTQPGVPRVLRSISTLIDKAAAGVFGDSMQQQQLATCGATAKTILLVSSCASLCVLYALELKHRLRYKQTLPPPIAAMQCRIHTSAWPLRIAQVLLLILYPTLVVAWVGVGLYHGLKPQLPLQGLIPTGRNEL